MNTTINANRFSRAPCSKKGLPQARQKHQLTVEHAGHRNILLNKPKLKCVIGFKVLSNSPSIDMKKLNLSSLQWCTELEATLNAELVRRQQTTDIAHCLTPKRTPTQDNHPKQ